jgi:hypothetical protein
MKITLKKPVCHNEVFWAAGSVIEAEKNWAAFAVGVGDAVEAPKDAELSAVPDLGPARQSVESMAMEKAAASIVTAVAKAATAGKKASKDADA